jgi:hypothetical protein
VEGLGLKEGDMLVLSVSDSEIKLNKSERGKD